ncbi:ribose 5-phosphate isomerase B [Candidatus Kryptobacter tengchongensis]|uniref:Ribose 5-phosphate isomerase B n=1 Tax=Kryptobacter tengchongensis TaxID=1643429 RepID=A0A916LL13_KRYT1|nr:ribose 5-phosphate isomerase B [Candidatus Kryptobacter tengchongensis]CUT03580.1 ribose 5-phosphate isomerase B [Candidatus Kryptobacter tengchongensis]CUU08684.1 ribose 5-phosphate isomerase B [Candidatus Kryptobacter tengchongensis]
MPKKLITEKTVVDLFNQGKTEIEIDKNTIVTPSARDKALQLRVKFVEKKETSQKFDYPLKPEPKAEGKKIVAIASDHAGFKLKEELKKFISELGYSILDLGTNSETPVDYPDFAYAVAYSIISGKAWRGIMIDGTGIASSIVANKVPGVRAACCYNEFTAKISREHNDANILTLGARVIGSELAKEIIKVFLETNFGGGRHLQRLNKIIEIEKRYSKQK